MIKRDHWFWRLRFEEGCDSKGDNVQGFFCVDETVCVLIMVVVTWVCVGFESTTPKKQINKQKSCACKNQWNHIISVFVVIQSLSCVWLCNPMDCGMPGSYVFHCLPHFAQTHVHWASDAIQPSHPLSPSSAVLNLSQHQGLFSVSWLFTSGGQSVRVSVWVLPMNIKVDFL